nr:hypothetical protein [Tanacetum cinerariifolium]
VICSTSASGLKPSSNTKNNRISQASNSNKTNKVKDLSSSVKSRKDKNNRVDKYKCNTNVMQSMLNANSVSEPISNALVKHSVPTVIAPRPAVSTDTPLSTTIDQDAPSTSTSQTTLETPSPVIPLGIEEADHEIKVAHMDNNPVRNTKVSATSINIIR